MELQNLLTKLKLDHLEARIDAVCEQAAQQQADYKTFLSQALATEWQGRYQRGIEARLRQARFPWIKTLEQLSIDTRKCSTHIHPHCTSNLRQHCATFATSLVVKRVFC